MSALAIDVSGAASNRVRALRWDRAVEIVIASVVAAGCASSQRARHAATMAAGRELAYGPGRLELEEVGPWSYRATGCGAEAWVRCHAGGAQICCRPATEDEAHATFAPHAYGGHSTGQGQVCEPSAL